MTITPLDDYVAALEHKVEKLENRVTRLEARLEATISIATREATLTTIKRLREALEDE